jgi:hypothetical protein
MSFRQTEIPLPAPQSPNCDAKSNDILVEKDTNVRIHNPLFYVFLYTTKALSLFFMLLPGRPNSFSTVPGSLFFIGLQIYKYRSVHSIRL